jgi:CRP/FNR family transcriptional regulator, cyclic AMP receptor protein
LSVPASLTFESTGTSLNLPANTILINEGFSADRVFVISSGSVKLMASSADGRLLILRVANHGEVIGLGSLSVGAHYRITAITLGPSIIRSIPRLEFLRLMRDSAELSLGISAAITRDYNAAVLSARRLGLSSSAAGKLASALLDWARMDHLDDSPAHTNLPISFAMPLTHEELGSMAGISRETVSRLLTKFRREGLIDQTDQQMVLHHPDQLESLYC